ncbi:pregnancy zone protein [Etheostoma spectabile]|uniref:pregnancy zone protein n=1 Tax=Etheostoma spectabile TaxID=54343 RepID=UPI0013AF0247|nr:pregnancy zone protein-like [Etheostoma spectabile]
MHQLTADLSQRGHELVTRYDGKRDSREAQTGQDTSSAGTVGVDRRTRSRLLQNLTTDSDGFAIFSLSTADFKGDIQLQVSDTPRLLFRPYRTPYYESNNHKVSLATLSSPDTKSVSSLDVKTKDEPLSCDKEEDIVIPYTIVGEAQGFVDVMYLVLSRGAIVTQGVKRVEVKDKSVNEGEVSFKLTVSPDMAPDVQVVAYAILPSETVIAKSADFSTEQCFSHKVSLEFSPSSAVPGEETIMQVTTQPESLCGVSAVDQSVLIKEPGKTLDANKIFQLLPVTKMSNIPNDIQDGEECFYVRPRRYVLPYPNGKMTADAYTVFQNVGMKMATNMVIREPSCLKYRGRDDFGDYEIMEVLIDRHLVKSAGTSGMSSPDKPPIETVRTFFPETWIWDLVEVGSLLPGAQQPYSIIRRGELELKATIFNYLTKPESMVGQDSMAVEVGDDVSVQNPDRQAPRFSPQAPQPPSRRDNEGPYLSSDGQKQDFDVVHQYHHQRGEEEEVEAPREPAGLSCWQGGEPPEVQDSLWPLEDRQKSFQNSNRECFSLSLFTGEALTEEMDIQLPEDIIDGSARASVSVLGDILGRALKNLDGLLQMPYGCGEQNMALLAPNIYILEYLKNTQQLTPAIKEKATNFLTSGYQRQLNYKDKDGAYSTFGAGPGNTWLTAFVLRSFTKAQSFIFIDQANIESSVTWLKSKQRPNGCFEQSGKLFNKNEATPTPPLVAYVFTWQVTHGHASHLLNHTRHCSSQEECYLHWSQTARQNVSTSLSVESAPMCCWLNQCLSAAEDLGYASRIALALYSTWCSVSGFKHSTVQSPSGQLTFDGISTTTALPGEKSAGRGQEEKEDRVLVYIRELTKDIVINHSLTLIQEYQVQNLKPAVVKLYDYYQPSDQSDREYIYPCVAA